MSFDDPYSLSNDEISFQFRHEFGLMMRMPRKVRKPLGDHHARMAEHWVELARRCGRPPYWEPRAFTRDRWMLREPRACCRCSASLGHRWSSVKLPSGTQRDVCIHCGLTAPADCKVFPRYRQTQSLSGSEAAYGPLSLTHWKYIWLAVRAAFLSGIHDAMGTTYETAEGGSRSLSQLSGVT